MRDPMLDCYITIEYGMRVLRPAYYGCDRTGVTEVFTGVEAQRLKCGYCGHPPGDGRHKCLNCGAPK